MILPYTIAEGDTTSNTKIQENFQALADATVSGAGDVAGPGSAVADNIAVFDGTTGKTLRDGGKKISELSLTTHNHTGTYEPANANIQSHISSTLNPHSVTATQVGLGNVDNTSDANKPVSTATQTALDGKVDENVAIVAATKTKITYDTKGLVTVGADATTADIASSTDKRYVKDADLVVIGNTSGTNTGDSASIPAVTPGTSGNLLTSNGSSWTSAAAPVSVSVTTKGDLQTYSTVPDRLAVGATNGHVLTVDSAEATGLKWAAAAGGGSTSFIHNETPSGTINSSNQTFTLANTPVTGTLQLYLNGQRLTYTGDYTLATATISMVIAPSTGDVLLADYQQSVSTSGNADTLDGQHGSYYENLAKNSPEGFLINGKIVPSVASNNLTVDLKGIDGNNPSASNPVYCRIGDTVRTITSSLSKTLNAGTNYFNSGSTELAAKEIDYFVYLVYINSTVQVAFARVPYFTRMAEPNGYNSTNAKDIAIDSTGVLSNDPMVVIGRFAATLSAGAGYTWTVPTFTPTNLIQRPIYESRRLAFSPVLTGFSSTGGNDTKYKIVGSTMHFDCMNIYGTSNSATFNFTLPLTAASSTTYQQFCMSVINNNSWAAAAGVLAIGSESATAKIGLTPANTSAFAYGGFTTSNQKGIIGCFVYQLN